MARHCAHCGAALEERAQFCHRCGAPRDGNTSSARPVAGVPPRSAATILPWAIAAIAVLSFVAFIAGQRFGGGRAAAPVASAAPSAAAAPGRAPDIASMSPQERADRLFFRVMTYVSEGKADSVQFFAPMAIQSFEALAPLNAHQRYDLGLLWLVSADAASARAQADSILADQPTHLLGIILAMRAAGLQNDTSTRDRFASQLSSVVQNELAKRLPEYEDHRPDIDAALREADGRGPAFMPPPTPE